MVEIIKQVVDIEQKLFSIPFASYGSLYYKKDFEDRFGKAALWFEGTSGLPSDDLPKPNHKPTS